MGVPENLYRDREYKTQIREWRGINVRPNAGDGELTETVNISTDNYPGLTTREGRAVVGNWKDAEDIYKADGHEFVCAGGKLYMDGEEITTVQTGTKQWAMVNSKVVIWPDKLYVDLNSGAVMRTDKTISSSISISKDGFLSVPGNVTASGTIRGRMSSSELYRGAELVESSKWYHALYGWTGLRRVDGRWEGTPKLVTLEHARNALTGWVGTEFTGETPPLIWQRFDQQRWEARGTVQGRITAAREVKSESGQYTRPGTSPAEAEYWTNYEAEFDYEVYETAKLNTQFEEGDTIRLEGSSLLYNNREYQLENVQQNGATIRGAVYRAYYKTLPEGDWPGGIYNVAGYKFNVTRALQPGEQLMLLQDAGLSGLTLGLLYVYNAETEVLTAFETATGEAAKTIDGMTDYSSATAETMTIRREAPDLDFICAHNNRLYGVSNHEENRIWDEITEKYVTVRSRTLHVSALGSPTQWSTYKGTAEDSYAVAIGGSGDFTAICEYSGAVLAFKEDKLFRLTGDYPEEYHLFSYDIDGVKSGCEDSCCIVNETLYYLSPAGVMAYTGSIPSLVSYQLGLASYRSATAGRCRIHYTICITGNTGRSEIYRYDTVHRLWVREDSAAATRIMRDGDQALMVIGGQIFRTEMSGDEDDLRWSATLAESDEGVFEKKRYRYIRILAEVPGTMKLEASENGGPWQVLGEVKKQPERRIHTFPADTLRCDRLQLRLSGAGKCTVHAMEREFATGSDR